MVKIYTPCYLITCCENRNVRSDETCAGACFVFIWYSLALFLIIWSSGNGLPVFTLLGVIIATCGVFVIVICLCKTSMITCHKRDDEKNVSNAPPHDLVLRSAPADNDDANDIESILQSPRNQEVKLSLHNIDMNEKSLQLSSLRKKKSSR